MHKTTPSYLVSEEESPFSLEGVDDDGLWVLVLDPELYG